jgi:hypothetical protein
MPNLTALFFVKNGQVYHDDDYDGVAGSDYY